jgi:ABC-type antimicrobial peptide transport system permease subunit
MNLEIRTAGDPMKFAGAVRREIYALDRDFLLGNVQTIKAYRDRGLGQERLSALLLSGLSILASVLAGIGLYGILAFAVDRRTREIGLRMALGATSGKVVGSVVGQALSLVAIGLCGGLVVALLLTRFVASMLFGVTSTDPLTYTVTALSLIAVGLIAAYVPARRASRVDPMVALRHE